MLDEDRKWMTYINDEVRAACMAKGWGYQMRRKWSVRDKPVSESPIDDYQWKLIPDADGELQEAPNHGFDEGTYYVLSLERSKEAEDPQTMAMLGDSEGHPGKFILQHDTAHYGEGPHWNLTSYTEIHLFRGPGTGPGTVNEYLRLIAQVQGSQLERRLSDPPPRGWLRGYLVDLTTRFGPNHFSIT